MYVVCCMIFQTANYILLFFFTLFIKPQPERHTFHTKPTHFLIRTGEDPLSFSGFLTTRAQEESQLQGSELTATIGIA